MTKMSTKILSLVLTAAFFYSSSAFADIDKSLLGSYGYIYNGTSYNHNGLVPFTETGVIIIDDDGSLSGEGTIAFYYSDFYGHGPLWLLIHEVQSDGMITQDPNNPCMGNIEFKATGTVIKTSNSELVAEGNVLFSDSIRSIAYTISGKKQEIVDMVSTSPGTIASGTAHKQKD
ncbi:hypothetical protein [Desulfobacter postgatei]|uniref:hypothetical protein n=1 Tax=Desulfobacter postgatei TaxID=2293 RepID=UPI00259B4D1B|nr:hypothetical protein [uncultured Desulfobacter sp.]